LCDECDSFLTTGEVARILPRSNEEIRGHGRREAAMGFFSNMFGGSAPAKQQGPASMPGVQPAGANPASRTPAESPQAVRKELVRVAVKDTLAHAGVPLDWIRVDPLTTQSPGREAGLSVRLVVLHWDSRLMVHAVALQNQLTRRLQALDPVADKWLMGINWQFQLMDESHCPPLPHPGSWTSQQDSGAAALDQAPDGGSADVISGPTRIGTQSRSRAELEKLLAQGDAAFRGKDDAFDKTQPMGFDKTQPMKMDR
jgi:hypothetical protein